MKTEFTNIPLEPSTLGNSMQQRTCLHPLPAAVPYPDILWEAKFKDERLINLEELISRQSNIQTVASLLPAASNQV